MPDLTIRHSGLEYSLDLSHPPVEVLLAGEGSDWSGERSIETRVGARLAYTGHESHSSEGWHELLVTLEDPVTGLVAQLRLRSPEGVGVVRAEVELTNRGAEPMVVQAVTSLVHNGLGISGREAWWADNEWLAEARWQHAPLRDLLVDVGRAHHEHDPRGSFARTSRGSWSSGRYLPMGALVAPAGEQTVAWQVEHSGPWRWEVGEREGTAYLAVLGPTDEHHQWRVRLAPGESVACVPAALALSAGGFDGALGELTRYRRLLRRPHPDAERLPVIFNDYMNTLMGDPTTARLLPLIDAAARAGAEYFCIDAGWFDHGGGWWDEEEVRALTARGPGLGATVLRD